MDSGAPTPKCQFSQSSLGGRCYQFITFSDEVPGQSFMWQKQDPGNRFQFPLWSRGSSMGLPNKQPGGVFAFWAFRL